MSDHSCLLSPLALVQSAKSDTIAFLPVESSVWGEQVSLKVAPVEPSDDPFLASLRSDTGRIIVAYHHNVAVCKASRATHLTEGGKVYWELAFREELTEFVPVIEPGLSSTSADELAEERARRLLLNENPAKETRDINLVFREVLVRGQGTLVQVQRSPFPTLFRHYGSDAQRFVEIAWILAAMQLKLSATVVQIEKMALAVQGHTLEVDFVGRRKKRFVNAPAPIIAVKGTCDLNQ
jgi:hypothetical protein